MTTIELTQLESEIIDNCNKLIKDFDMTVEKIKSGRKVKYCLTRNGYELLCNDNLISVDTFCKNKDDLEMLASVANQTIKMKQEQLEKAV